MILFLASALAASLIANLALAITTAHLVEQRTTRPARKRPAPRVDPHPVDPSRPYRKARRSLLADTTEVPVGGRRGTP